MSDTSESGVSISSSSKQKTGGGDESSAEEDKLSLAATAQADEGAKKITEVSPLAQQSLKESAVPKGAHSDDLSEKDDVATSTSGEEIHKLEKSKAKVEADTLKGEGDDDPVRLDSSEDDSVDEDDERYRLKFKDFDKRLKLAPRRKKQYNQYVDILEERIQMLENRCNEFDRERGRGPPPPPPMPKPEEPPIFDLDINFQFWSAFSKGKSKHMIDVLVDEPDMGNTKKSRRRTAWVQLGQSGQYAATPEIVIDYPAAEEPTTNEQSLESEVERLRGNSLPERIRINAPAILVLFHKVLGVSCTAPPNTILRPFKPLLRNETQMRETMAETLGALNDIIQKRPKAEIEHNDNEELVPSMEQPKDEGEVDEDQPQPERVSAPSQDSAPDRPPDNISPVDWTTVLQELNLFHCAGCSHQMWLTWPTISDARRSFEAIAGLLDDFIKPVNTKLRSGKAEKVRFCDLWHLFNVGDEIMVRENPKGEEDNIAGKVALKVLRTSGGRRVMVPPLTEGAGAFPPGMPPPPPPPPYPPSLRKPPTPPSSVDGLLEPVDGINPFCIHAYYLDFDGSRLVPVRRRFIVTPYSGERLISSLSVYPIAYAPENDMGRAALEARGKKFMRFADPRKVTYLDCTGLELRTREELNDKVIVDMKEYYRIEHHRHDIPKFTEPEEPDNSELSDCPHNDWPHKSCPAGLNCPSRTVFVIPDHGVETTALQEYRANRREFKPTILSNDHASNWLPDWSICHYRLFAYKLRSREWVAVDVDNLEPPKLSEINMGFRQLVLPDDHKDILESQVREHFRKRGAQGSNVAAEDDMDLVRGKGQGLILLLHGAPGVGKTATAECIADLVEKPLYPITCGDLGSTAEDVEWNLKKHFTLASKWDCVMLLDEADVFLAKRRQADLQRNSIVSVFLRMLEYYKGLLFLTTNRVGTFDEAFKSRVHISLFYPNFDRETTMRVWKTFIKQTKMALKRNNRTGIHIDKEGILAFAMDHWEHNPDARWNGRQIRNAFHTAVAMAEFKARGGNSTDREYDLDRDVEIKVGRSQFQKIANTVKEFDDYMRETMGTSYDAEAAKHKMRARGSGAGSKSSKKKQRKHEDEDSSSEESEEVPAKVKMSKKKPRKKKEETSSSEETETRSTRDRDRSKKSKKKLASSSDEEPERTSTKGKSKKKQVISSSETEETSTKGTSSSKKLKKPSRAKRISLSSSDESEEVPAKSKPDAKKSKAHVKASDEKKEAGSDSD